MLKPNRPSILTDKAVARVLAVLIPRKHTNTSTLYDVGYEQAKADIAEVFSQELNVEFTQGVPVQRMIKDLKR